MSLAIVLFGVLFADLAPQMEELIRQMESARPSP